MRPYTSGSPPRSLYDRASAHGRPYPRTLTVCGLDELDGHSARGVTHVLSILYPEWPEPEAFSAFEPHARATFRFHDAIEPGPGVVLPQKSDIEAMLAFGRDAGRDPSHLLIHCHAGISRSTAAMLMILAQAFPDEPEDAIVDRLTQSDAGVAKLAYGRFRRRDPRS